MVFVIALAVILAINYLATNGYGRRGQYAAGLIGCLLMGALLWPGGSSEMHVIRPDNPERAFRTLDSLATFFLATAVGCLFAVVLFRKRQAQG